MTQTCSVCDCDRQARSHGLCWSHYKRRRRNREVNGPLRGYGRSKAELLGAAATRYAEAETEDEFERAKWLLLKYGCMGPKRSNRKLSKHDKRIQD